MSTVERETQLALEQSPARPQVLHPVQVAWPNEHVRVLILGGYGTFGGRLAQLLMHSQRLTLIIAGRSLAKAKAFCGSFPTAAQLLPAAVDRDGDLLAQIRPLAPQVVVDAMGPFQDYGAEPYRVVKACLALGVHYLDLADGSAFVDGIRRFEDEARAKRLFILSGVSSFPVLTAAVVRALSSDMQEVASICGGIVPSPYAGVGLNVIRALAGYAGQPVRVAAWRSRTLGHALVDSRRCNIAPPGYLPLQQVRLTLVDVPDLQVLPTLWPHLREVWMGAGPLPSVLHRSLTALAWLVQVRLLSSLAPFARLFHTVINTVRWGEHRGGMVVEIVGTDGDGQWAQRSWHMVAEGDDGPLVPVMGIQAVLRRCLNGAPPPAGARPATEDLELADYEALFNERRIFSGKRLCRSIHAPLYRRLLDTAFDKLPPAIQAMHDVTGLREARGTATVTRGRGWLARLTAAVMGFPKAGENVPVTVTLRYRKCGRDGDGELWERDFAGQRFHSVQSAGRERTQYLLMERFGPCKFGIALIADGQKLRYEIRRWSFLGIRLPRRWAPSGETYEAVMNDRFYFHVEIGHPLTGLIVRYQGELTPVV
jgi:hypothetical protein